jgi:purine-nucleoside phosphorylase
MGSDVELGTWNVEPAVAAIRGRWKCEATTAIILGSGLGDLAEEVHVEAAIDYREIPGFAHSTALAHKGRLVCGTLHGQPVVMLQGRCHLYEGHSLQRITFPTRVLAALGIQTLIATNAAGGINPNYAMGDVMLIDDHINLMWFGSHWRVGEGRTGGVSLPVGAPMELSDNIAGKRTHPARRARVYDRELAEQAAKIARRNNFVLQRGVYVGVTGPCYETRAEYRAFRRLGGDCVGMSTVPEVLTAASLGMRVLALSTVTNVACPDAPQIVSADAVVEVAGSAVPKIRAILEGVLAAPRSERNMV